jgi:hypothetical protein
VGESRSHWRLGEEVVVAVVMAVSRVPGVDLVLELGGLSRSLGGLARLGRGLSGRT